MDVKVVAERIEALRQKMKQDGVSLYMISKMDFHMSEYPAEYFNTLEYMSGFTGSNGMMLVTENHAHLWTDGRYTIQANEELAGTDIQIHIFSDMEDKIRTLPMFFSASGEAFFDAMVDDGAENRSFNPEKFRTVIGCDGRTFSFGLIEEIVDNLGIAFDSGAVVIDAKLDLVGEVWGDERPALPCEKIEMLDFDFAGERVSDKLRKVRERLSEFGSDAGAIVTALDDICWLFNIRGRDVHNNLFTLAYSYINWEDAYLFIDARKVPGKVREQLEAEGVMLRGYDEFYGFLEEAPNHFIAIDPSKNNAAVVVTIGDRKDVALVTSEGLVEDIKCIKNEIEVNNSLKAHFKDALVMIVFIKWLKENVGKVAMTEVTAGQYLDLLRKKGGAICPSFDTICAYGPHAAICHYSATAESDIPILPEGLLLVDSGGQYYGGTTDITRTIPLGPLSDEMKRDYTLAVCGMLELMNAVFPQGIIDNQLDVLAREPMWKHGIDYDHGTGHGVGAMLGVHEGPQSISYRKRGRNIYMQPGMITSCEPGIYREGQYGIRHENEILCVRSSAVPGYLTFKPITFVPIDTAGIDVSYMTAEQIKMLNDYNNYVYDTLCESLDDEYREWLKRETAPIGQSEDA